MLHWGKLPPCKARGGKIFTIKPPVASDALMHALKKNNWVCMVIVGGIGSTLLVKSVF